MKLINLATAGCKNRQLSKGLDAFKLSRLFANGASRCSRLLPMPMCLYLGDDAGRMQIHQYESTRAEELRVLFLSRRQ